jgi:DNA-binding transcriptional LysR family regulator
VRITASVGFGQICIVPLVAELRRRHGGLRIELLATDANLDLAAEGIDLAVRLASRPEGDYVVTKLRDTRYRVVGSPAFAARSQFSRPADLIGAPCLCFPLPGFRTSWKFRDAAGQIEEVPVSGPIQASTSIALRELAQDGLGATLLADWLIDRDIEAGALVDLFPDYEVTATQFDSAAWLLYPSRKFVPAKTRAVVAFLKEKLGAAAIR